MYSIQEMSDESLKEERGGNAFGNTDLVKKKNKIEGFEFTALECT